MFVFVLVIFLLISWIYYIRTRHELLLKLKHVPDGIKHYPVIGIVHSIIGKLPEEIVSLLLNEISTLSSSIGKFFIFTKLFIGVKNPAYIQKILSSPICLEKGFGYSTVPFGNGLVTAKYTLWKNHRKLLNSTFHITLFHKTFMKQFNEMAHMLVADLQCKNGIEPFDIKPFVAYHSISLQLKSTFDSDIGDEEIQIIHKTTEILQRIGGAIVVNSFKYFLFNFIAKLLKIKFSTERLINKNMKHFEPFIKIARNQYFEKIKMLEYSEVDVKNNIPEALIYKLVELEDRGYFTNQDVKDHLTTMIFAGSDTITTALSSCILCLAMNEHAQENCAIEIKEVMGDQFDKINIDDFTKLELLERTINECLRLFPSVPIIMRRCDEDYELDDNIIIPAGAEIIIPIIVVHRCKEFWGDNPTKFDPDNFLPENIAKRPPLSYIPYSYGARNCIGKKYAQYALKVLLAHLLVNYKFSTELKFEDLKATFGLTLLLQNKHMVRIEKR